MFFLFLFHFGMHFMFYIVMFHECSFFFPSVDLSFAYNYIYIKDSSFRYPLMRSHYALFKLFLFTIIHIFWYNVFRVNCHHKVKWSDHLSWTTDSHVLPVHSHHIFGFYFLIGMSHVTVMICLCIFPISHT